jgi:hypothetical protein
LRPAPSACGYGRKTISPIQPTDCACCATATPPWS